MKRRRGTTNRQPEGDIANASSLLAKDGTMRTLAAVAGFLAGVIGSHLEMGRRIDGLTSQVQALAARVESVEKCMDRHAIKK